MTTQHFHIPASFDVAKIPKLRRFADQTHWVLDNLSYRLSDPRYEFDDGRAELSSVVMQRHMGRKYAFVLDCLVKSGWLACDGKYITARKAHDGIGHCKRYGFGRPLDGGLRKIECGSKTVAKKMLASLQVNDIPVDESVFGPARQHLLQSVKAATIDADNTRRTIAAWPDDLSNPGNRLGPKASAEMLVDKIADGQREFGTDWWFGDRVHTTFTRLRSDLRQFIRLDGCQLAAVDLANSQLLFVIPLMQAAGIRDGQFAADVQAGKFYDVLMEESGTRDRNQFKRLFFRDVLYADNNLKYSIDSQLTALVRRIYPDFMQFIIAYKKAHGFKALSQGMQRAESALMIDRVCGRLALTRPDVKLLTVHDSIMVAPDHIDMVETIIMEEFAKLNITPTMKREAAAPMTNQNDNYYIAA